MTVAAPDHQEMNRQDEATRRIFHTIAHYLMVHTRVLEAYIYFSLIYTTDHIFPVLPIKDMINKEGGLTMPFKLATGTDPSVSHLCVLFFHVLYRKLLHTSTKRR